MKNQRKTWEHALVSAVGLAATASLLPAADTSGTDLRVRTEYSVQGDKTTLTNTLGLAPQGSYGDTPISLKGQYCEEFRLYDVWQKNGDSWTQYDAFGLRAPEIKLGALTNRALLFGSVGDTEGFGIETTHTYGPATATFNAEHRTDIGSTRFGGGLDLDLSEKLKIGLGYDQINTDQGSSEQYIMNAIYDITPSDTLGAAFVLRKEADDSETKSLAGFWNHYTSEDEWGLRALARVDWNEEQDVRSYGGEIIWAAHATTPKPGATWWIGRTLSSDEAYNTSIIPASLGRVESVRLQDRSSSGLSLAARAFLREVGEDRSGVIGGGIGYTFKEEILGGKLGVSGDTNYHFSDSSTNVTFEPSILYRKHNFEIDAGITIPVEGGEPAFRVGLQWKF